MYVYLYYYFISIEAAQISTHILCFKQKYKK